jgi:hypothetical protein
MRLMTVTTPMGCPSRYSNWATQAALGGAIKIAPEQIRRAMDGFDLDHDAMQQTGYCCFCGAIAVCNVTCDVQNMRWFSDLHPQRVWGWPILPPSAVA